MLAALMLVTMLVTFCPLGASQVQGVPQVPSPTHTPQIPGIRGADTEPLAGPSPEKLEHMREDDRRKRLLSDTAKLLALSTELKEQVEKSSKDELSLDVVRKAAEIEKLAHDVKERMKG